MDRCRKAKQAYDRWLMERQSTDVPVILPFFQDEASCRWTSAYVQSLPAILDQGTARQGQGIWFAYAQEYLAPRVRQLAISRKRENPALHEQLIAPLRPMEWKKVPTAARLQIAKLCIGMAGIAALPRPLRTAWAELAQRVRSGLSKESLTHLQREDLSDLNPEWRYVRGLLPRDRPTLPSGDVTPPPPAAPPAPRQSDVSPHRPRTPQPAAHDAKRHSLPNTVLLRQPPPVSSRPAELPAEAFAAVVETTAAALRAGTRSLESALAVLQPWVQRDWSTVARAERRALYAMLREAIIARALPAGWRAALASVAEAVSQGLASVLPDDPQAMMLLNSADPLEQYAGLCLLVSTWPTRPIYYARNSKVPRGDANQTITSLRVEWPRGTPATREAITGLLTLLLKQQPVGEVYVKAVVTVAHLAQSLSRDECETIVIAPLVAALPHLDALQQAAIIHAFAELTNHAATLWSPRYLPAILAATPSRAPAAGEVALGLQVVAHFITTRLMFQLTAATSSYAPTFLYDENGMLDQAKAHEWTLAMRRLQRPGFGPSQAINLTSTIAALVRVAAGSDMIRERVLSVFEGICAKPQVHPMIRRQVVHGLLNVLAEFGSQATGAPIRRSAVDAAVLEETNAAVDALRPLLVTLCKRGGLWVMVENRREEPGLVSLVAMLPVAEGFDDVLEIAKFLTEQTELRAHPSVVARLADRMVASLTTVSRRALSPKAPIDDRWILSTQIDEWLALVNAFTPDTLPPHHVLRQVCAEVNRRIVQSWRDQQQHPDPFSLHVKLSDAQRRQLDDRTP